MADLTTDSVDSSDERILGLFAKAWDARAVKTRLAATLGDTAAVEIYKRLLTVNLLRFANSAEHRVVACSPADESTKERFRAFMSQMNPPPCWELVSQSDGGLGTRMSFFFQQQFAIHGDRSRVVLIGSDAVRLSCNVMEEAFELLREHDVVFGPSTDGGYYLVGMSKANECIFEDIEWSTEKVLEQSLATCKAAGLEVALLKPLTDIDTEEDLKQEIEALQRVDDDNPEVWLQDFVTYSMNILEGKS